MRNSNPNQIARYIREVQPTAGREMYSNFVNPREIQSSANAVQANAAYNSAASLPIIINVANSTNGNLTAILFGAAQYQFSTNFGNPTGITVSSGNTNINYQQILSTTISTPFSCAYVRLIDTGVTNQVQQAWTVTSVNLEGQQISTPIPNSASFSPFQQQAGILDLIYPLKVDGMTNIQFIQLGNSTTNTMTLYFYPNAMVSPINTLVTGNPQATYATPNLPTVFSTSPVAAISASPSVKM